MEQFSKDMLLVPKLHSWTNQLTSTLYKPSAVGQVKQTYLLIDITAENQRLRKWKDVAGVDRRLHGLKRAWRIHECSLP